MESPNPFSREAFLAPAPSPKPSKNPLAPRKKRLLFGAIGAVTLCGMASFFVPYLIREYRHNPYPTIQNGMILRAIHASAPKNNPIGCPNIEVELPHGAHLQSLRGRASTGDIFSLGRGASNTLPANLLDLMLGDRRRVVINLPQFGVPSTVEWLDVTIEDDRKHRGTWRVYGLPYLKRALPPVTPVRTEQTVHGIAVGARVWRYPAPDSFNASAHIQCEIKGFVPPAIESRPAAVWSANIEAIHFDWEPQLSSPSAGEVILPVANLPSEPLGRSGVFYTSVSKRDDSWSPTVQRRARIEARLTRYDATTETVTFRNVPLVPLGDSRKAVDSSRSLVTPSGLRVQLYNAKNILSHASNAPFDVAVGYRVSAGPSFHPPVTDFQFRSTIRGDDNACRDVANTFIPNPLASDKPERSGRENRAFLIGLKNARQTVLPSLTVSVSLLSARQTVPITFIAPIGDAPPKELWNKQ